ncbi:hypothetical protein ILYODFUR_031582 [Ilyodon furcidens]|uniref:Uncharacterized protein n=1 Tax=Ilyodon furcidens TaxID=33524 RepID=A0ABV0UL50_9TELE
MEQNYSSQVYLTVLPSETPILSLTQSWFQITFTPVKPNKLFKTLSWFTLGCVIQSLVKPIMTVAGRTKGLLWLIQ